MTCQQIADFLMDYLTGDLPKPARVQFDQHLSVCSACRHYLDSYRKTIAIGKASVDPVNAVRDMPESLVQSILQAASRTDPNDRES